MSTEVRLQFDRRTGWSSVSWPIAARALAPELAVQPPLLRPRQQRQVYGCPHAAGCAGCAQ